MPYRPEPDHREIPGRPRFPESPIPNPQSRFRAMTTQPHSHIVKSRDEERNRVINEILRMGSMAAAQLEAALDVLERRDDKAAERIIGNDEEIDKLERQISQDAMTLALRGPLVRDLREILATLRIVSEIERLGDYAAIRSEEHTSELQSLMRSSY